jgi:tryptophan synthase alpha chain
MSRISACFEGLKKTNRTALIPYITAGDPEPGITVKLMHAMVESGANLIELGVPFSDPMADGPVIQAASERALHHHVSLTGVIGMVAEFRQTNQDTPVVLMGYLNPIEVMGYQAFAQAASKAGVDGVLTVDIPPEESAELVTAFKQFDIDPIFLISPTSSADRISTICQQASGFIYYVSLKGVTGAANLDVASVKDKIAQIRQYTDLPVGVGFGINNAEAAAQVSACADAVVVGSALVKQVEAHQQDADKITTLISDILSAMRKAMDA